MKPIYNESTLKWRVKGLGLFDTAKDAWMAIAENTNNTQLNIMVSPKMMNDLRASADARKISVSKLVRQAIENELK